MHGEGLEHHRPTTILRDINQIHTAVTLWSIMSMTVNNNNNNILALCQNFIIIMELNLHQN